MLEITASKKIFGFLVLLLFSVAGNLQGQNLFGQDRAVRVLEQFAEEKGQKAPVVTALCVQASGDLLVSAGDDHLIRVWNRNTGELVWKLTGHQDWVRAAQFSPDGKSMATAGNDREIFLWDMEKGEEISRIPQEEAVCVLKYSPDGKYLAAAGASKFLSLYETGTGKKTATLLCADNDTRTIAFSADSQNIVAAGRTGVLRIWKTQTGQKVADIQGHKRRVRALVFSADGKTLFSAAEDKTLRGWDMATSNQLFSLSSGGAKIQSMALCNERCLATAGTDNSIQLWDLQEKRQVGVLNGHKGSIVALEADGEYLVSGSYDTTVRVWDLSEGIDMQKRGKITVVPVKSIKSIIQK
ncbi:MAG: WD40 repeat domain-containing protein [Pirellulaceae bacterium]|nr:WD40 repeat domain-containing protein [Pirellulaceae bacterium]